MLNPGDVFVARLSDGRYTAARVLRTSAKSALVCTSPYLCRDLPAIEDPLLREVVKQVRFFYKGDLAMKWLEGAPPRNLRLLGNAPPTKADEETECGVYGGAWSEESCNEAFLEWRWVHDRPAFEEEVRKKREEAERRRRLPQQPKKMMDEGKFWSIIGQLDWKHQGNDKKVLAPAVDALASLSKAEICCFEERLAFLLYQLDTRAHAANSSGEPYAPGSRPVSADEFLYARCVVVANGRRLYEAVLGDPARMPKGMEFESLLGLASASYELKTGETFKYSTGCSYESFSNSAGWQ